MRKNIINSIGIALSLLLLNTSQLKAQVPVNDLQSNATVLTDFNDWISADAAYTNVGATYTTGLGLNNNNDVWFKFTATANVMEIKTFMTGTRGNIVLPHLYLFDDQDNLLADKRATWYNVPNAGLLGKNLVVGDDYYIVISSSTSGTFTLYMNDELTNDWIEGAHDLSGVTFPYYSQDAEFSTHGATQDSPQPLDNDHYLDDVWFKFDAQSTEIEFKILAGGAKFQYGYGPKGTASYFNVRLFDENMNIIKHNTSFFYDVHVVGFANDNLQVGDTYYISMTNYNPYATFSIYMNDQISNDWLMRAENIPHQQQWYSGDAARSNFDYGVDSPRSPEMNSMHNGKRYWTNDAWYEFTATTNELKAELFRGGQYGTLSNPRLHLYSENLDLLQWDEDKLVTSGLVVGEKYYLTVAAQYAGGSYGLDVSNETSAPANNHWDDALMLTDLNEWYSANAGFSNINSTAGAPLNDRPAVWFKFVADTPEAEVKVLSGGTRGDMYETKVYLFDANQNLLTSTSAKYNVTYRWGLPNHGVYKDDLTIGDTYYIGVATANQSDAGTFKLHVSNEVSNDYVAHATDLTGLGTWRSADQEFTSVDATRDVPGPGGWAKAVWFKFTAESDVYEVKAFDQGSIGLTYLKIFDSSFNMITNKRSVWYNSPVTGQQIQGLTVGEVYYISVDGGEAEGKFALSIHPGTTNDFRTSPTLIDNPDDWYSGDAGLDNTDFSPDRPGTPNYSYHADAWFKFTAESANLEASIYSGGVKGTAGQVRIELFDDNFTYMGYSYNTLNNSSLTVGNDYYIAAVPNVPGTYSLWIDNVDGPRTFYAIADGNWNDPATWSTSENGSSINQTPSSQDEVIIKEHTVTVDSYQESGIVTINQAPAGQLIVDGSNAHLKVFGNMIIKKGDGNTTSDKALHVKNTGRVELAN